MRDAVNIGTTVPSFRGARLRANPESDSRNHGFRVCAKRRIPE